jgi:DNA-binding response OmpR family regulator
MADILVVDDDPDLATALADVLGEAGHSTRVANDGWAGLAALEQHLPDLVVMDVEMPALDGPGMAQQMFVTDLGREEIPILLVSACVALPSVAKRVGTPYSVAKPCRLDELLRIVDRALLERRAPHPQLTVPAESLR